MSPGGKYVTSGSFFLRGTTKRESLYEGSRTGIGRNMDIRTAPGLGESGILCMLLSFTLKSSPLPPASRHAWQKNILFEHWLVMERPSGGVADFFSLMFQYTERGDTNVTALHRFLRCDDFAHLLLVLYTTYSIVPYPLAHFFLNIRSGSLI